MLDDLREQAGDSDFNIDEDEVEAYSSYKTYREKPKLFLGMTPVQRFVIAVLMLLMVGVMGAFVLLVTEKLYFPFA